MTYLRDFESTDVNHQVVTPAATATKKKMTGERATGANADSAATSTPGSMAPRGGEILSRSRW